MPDLVFMWIVNFIQRSFRQLQSQVTAVFWPKVSRANQIKNIPEISFHSVLAGFFSEACLSLSEPKFFKIDLTPQ